MKNLFTPFILCLVFTFSFGQNIEFETYSNGLIYNEPTMNKLKKMADSLQLNFKKSELDKTYYSKYQAEGYFI
ncbi:MAG: hypothetical protein AB8B69_23505, partial [Chitinophagales bacterium]